MPSKIVGCAVGIYLAITLMAASAAAEAQTRGPGAVGYTSAERRQVDQRLDRLSAEFGLTNQAISSAIPSLAIPNFNIQNPQHRDQLRSRLRALARLRHGLFDVLNRSVLISANMTLEKEAQAAIAKFDQGSIDQSIHRLLVLNDALLAHDDGLDDFQNVSQLIAALYRAGGQSDLADEFLDECRANEAWARSEENWAQVMCAAQTAISRAVSNGSPSELRLALASVNRSASVYQSASGSQLLPWEIESDLFNAAALNLVFEAPSKTTDDVLNLGERLLSSYRGNPSDYAYLELRQLLALFYGYGANFGANPQHFQRAKELINDLSVPAAAPAYLKYRIVAAECQIGAAEFSQGLEPDPSSLYVCANAMQIAEQAGFTDDCILEARLLALEAYFNLAGIFPESEAANASYEILNKIFDDEENTALSPYQKARLEYLLARAGMQMLDRMPPMVANFSIGQMLAIDSNFAHSRSFLFDAGYGPYWNSWAIMFMVHQAQVNVRTANITFENGAPVGWQSASSRREAAMQVLDQLRIGYGLDIPPRMAAMFEFMTSVLVMEGEGRSIDTILERVQVHERRLEQLTTEGLDIHIYDRTAILMLLTSLKEWGGEVDATRIEPHLTSIKEWQEGPRANTIPIPIGIVPWINKTFGLAIARDIPLGK